MLLIKLVCCFYFHFKKLVPTFVKATHHWSHTKARTRLRSWYVVQYLLITCLFDWILYCSVIVLNHKLLVAATKKKQKTAQSDPRSSLILTSSFLSTCAGSLDTVVPLKVRCPRPKTEPWLKDTTRAARRVCRRAGRRWKKDKLHICQQILKVGESIRKSLKSIIVYQNKSVYNKT